MVSKRSKKSSDRDAATTSTDAPTLGSPAPSNTPPGTAMASNGKKTKPASPAPQSSSASSSSSALVICRNKHWRYISSFHGPWLQLPLEVLETLANANYYMPLPRPVDPSVFYDLVKIRQLVDGATDLAVRAANGVTSSSLSSSLAGGAAHHMQALGLGFGNNGGMKLSPERRFRMREQATQKLSRAYHLDEIASSVATMQSTSTLENVAGLVLQRSPEDPDANYVHFFHEKIPSRQLAECTDLRALDLIISQRPSDTEPLRTRAIVRMFKEDFEGAVQDLTTALNVYRLQRPMHRQPPEEAMQLERRTWRRRDNPPLEERDQPSSTEVQLLFQRAGCYLTLACDHVEGALPKRGIYNGATNGASNGAGSDTPNQDPVEGGPDATQEDKGLTKKQLERRKIVRLFAKRALRDYMEYFKHFHYSPNLPIEISDDFTRQVNQATNRTKRYYNQSRMSSQDSTSPTGSSAGHTVYALATLFSASPPADLPAYPSTALVSASAIPEPMQTTTEVVTYHPLLIDALHSLLMCHTLIQTSAKELQRHAYMVTRLARLADGYPVFQASRSPARADWIEVLRRAENWIELSASWETLCAPAPLPTMSSVGSGVSAAAASANALAITSGASSSAGETEEQRKERMRHQAILEALEDERVNDEASFKAAILARQRRAEADQQQHHAVTAAAGPHGSNGNSSAAPGLSLGAAQKRWAVVEGREYPILTERAEAVARWVREAPPAGSSGTGGGGGGGRRKKKASAKNVTAAAASAAAAASVDTAQSVETAA
ncbi:hypothetical protein DL766_004854 [Monosporascus sp. MC13-8B]|uniref:Histidine kinase group protein n=1 Tax=Monosporascus cannonballus TaxID=155416 RepID=A0ABY0GYV9_9PEZI|nr:hypothetical protein DL762_007528 [Monosporascus cannonballus]RYO99917.1 hypothetical protein DL763_001200 [Monosporascus cannonballus]RYP30461.1 hypothetical protein DL766_004854 [Monosporascus sp. MC13-8B]